MPQKAFKGFLRRFFCFRLLEHGANENKRLQTILEPYLAAVYCCSQSGLTAAAFSSMWGA